MNHSATNDTAARPIVDTKELRGQLRPAFTPLNIMLMVLFFVVGVWPLGLAAIAYMAYGKQMGIDLSNWGEAKRSGSNLMASVNRAAQPKTGNAAFDDWRETELKRLDEERRKLDEARAEFDEYVRELRRARDADEFDAWRRRQTVDANGVSDRGERSDATS